MNDVVRVLVPRPVWGTYDYRVPNNGPRPVIGGRVRVPFGQSAVTAVALEYVKQPANNIQLKNIDKVIDEDPLLTSDLLDLVQWMSDYYHFPLGSVLGSVLPVEAMRGRPLNVEPEKKWCVESTDTEDIPKNAHRQRELLELLSRKPWTTDSELRQQKIAKPVLEALHSKKLIRWEYVEVAVDYRDVEFSLTEEQSRAVDCITSSLDSFAVHVLDGVTGSGKTEVYIRAIQRVLEMGKQVLVLVPEISLTPQTAESFASRFGSVAVLHSMRTNVQRFDVWTRVGSGEHRLVIGTRSAVFAPFKNLGLIVVDEEHDSSYKQGETLRYSARDVAIVRANKLGIPCVLGSATPSLETLHNVETGKYSMATLSHRPGTAEMPSFNVLDIRGHQLVGGMSPQLISKIREHLNAEAQVLILINRRGYARSVVCNDCGWIPYCVDCSVKLTLHDVPTAELRCHQCERRYRVPETCTSCDSKRVRSVGSATQRVEETLQMLFENVPTYRVDRDSTNSSGKLERLFANVKTQEKCILVGTQMLSKGHHFPNVTLVAVIGADAGFLSTDFRAAERTAQLIVQVAGRAGRAQRRGEVWIQSLDPHNPNLQALVIQGYRGFVSAEQYLRDSSDLPPRTHMAVLRCEGSNADEQERFLLDRLAEVEDSGVEALGPVPAPIARIAGRWRYQAALVSPSRTQLHNALRKVERKTSNRSKSRWSIDVDPADMA